MIDKHFNRIIGETENIYITNYGAKACFNEKYNGYVKCKLIHSRNDSLIFAEYIFLPDNNTKFHWIQPLTFFANLLCEDNDNDIIYCGFHIDISSGNTIRVDFTNKDWIRNFEDNSSLFKCIINGPQNLYDYSTGTGCFYNNIPYLTLYHHTTSEFKSLILKSKTLKPSKWNIQGTKILTNIHYAYFTCLEKIEKDADLTQIAMASNGVISLIPDNVDLPPILYCHDKEKYKDHILNIKVYRESTYNRNATLKFLISTTILSPKHLWKHLPKDGFAFYEICMPFIFRVGVKPNCSIDIDKLVIDKQEDMETPSYHVVGLATNMVGLEAPFDEENTEYLFKVEPLDSYLNILNFWFDHANKDLYSPKDIDLQKFDNTSQ